MLKRYELMTIESYPFHFTALEPSLAQPSPTHNPDIILSHQPSPPGAQDAPQPEKKSSWLFFTSNAIWRRFRAAQLLKIIFGFL